MVRNIVSFKFGGFFPFFFLNFPSLSCGGTCNCSILLNIVSQDCWNWGGGHRLFLISCAVQKDDHSSLLPARFDFSAKGN